MWQLIKQRVEPFTLMIPEREFLQYDMEKSDLCWKRELVDDILTPNILLLLTCGAIVAPPSPPLPTFINTPGGGGLTGKHFNPIMSCHHALTIKYTASAVLQIIHLHV